uniref:Uncharacterized protein n=1 Tax=Octopus bimaculoides TaxID=37653 RepID=A0A0L8GSU2_OCTBM
MNVQHSLQTVIIYTMFLAVFFEVLNHMSLSTLSQLVGLSCFQYQQLSLWMIIQQLLVIGSGLVGWLFGHCVTNALNTDRANLDNLHLGFNKNLR